jgi:hypothetical protein
MLFLNLTRERLSSKAQLCKDSFYQCKMTSYGHALKSKELSKLSIINLEDRVILSGHKTEFFS